MDHRRLRRAAGVLNFRGRNYALSTGGLDYGLVFRRIEDRAAWPGGATSTARRMSPASMARRVRGLAVGGGGARAIVLTNQKGAVLELSGRQVGVDGQCGFERAGDYVESNGMGVIRQIIHSSCGGP